MRRTGWAVACVAAAGLVALALTGCTAGSGTPPAPPRQTLTVFAAASLGEAFGEIATDVEHANPGLDVRLNLAGSSSLAAQVAAGAPADVLATADRATMDRLAASGVLAGPPRAFATNVLTLVTPPGNPAGIGSLSEAAAQGADLVACAPQVPCGHAARALAARAGITLSPVSEESSVTDVLGKVVSGQADAGLVYATDAAGAGAAVHEVALEDATSAVNTYPIAAVAPAGGPAERFVEHVLGDRGQQVLREHGFGTP